MAAKKKKSEYKKAKDKAWSAFSKYIRTKYSKDGQCVCITCGTQRGIKEMHAGHGIGGRGMGILFEEKVVRPQCPRCNMPPPYGKGGNYNIYVPWLIDQYGRDGYDELLTQSNTPTKYLAVELKEMEQKYKNKIAELDEK